MWVDSDHPQILKVRTDYAREDGTRVTLTHRFEAIECGLGPSAETFTLVTIGEVEIRDRPAAETFDSLVATQVAIDRELQEPTFPPDVRITNVTTMPDPDSSVVWLRLVGAGEELRVTVAPSATHELDGVWAPPGRD